MVKINFFCIFSFVLISAFLDSDVLNSILNAMKMTDNTTEKKAAAGSSSSVSERSSPIKEPAVDVGGSVPFLSKPDLLDTIMCRQKIGPRCKLCLKFRVTKPEQEMRWRFRALKGKLTFVIYRQKITDTEINSTCQQPTNNEIKPEYSQLYASFGKYLLTFLTRSYSDKYFQSCFNRPFRPQMVRLVCQLLWLS